MLIKSQVAVKDACIIFDLIELDLLSEFFELGICCYTTISVIEEIRSDEQIVIIEELIRNESLKIDELGNDDLVYTLFDENPGLSFADCSVLEVALRKQCILLSADKTLRNESKRRSIEVRGILWIIEQLVNNELISIKKGKSSLLRYAEFNPRAPKKEIDELIKKFKMRN